MNDQTPDATTDGAPPDASSLGARIIRAPDVLEEEVEPLLCARSSVRIVDERVVDSIERAGIDLERVERRAEEIVERARREADDIRERARAEGHAEGLEEVVELIGRARKEYSCTLEAAEDDLLELASRLARRIIGEAIELEPTRVHGMVAGVLRHARGKKEITVAVSPDDRPALESSQEALSRRVDGVPVHFEEDDSLERGSCIIRTESGRIDGRIETQLQTLLHALRGK